ncbi:pentapeptide repeat-containing protein [Massilia sp. H-1]|nr:pentapeptide repeat-containing protein [Massilia sp. H-1]
MDASEIKQLRARWTTHLAAEGEAALAGAGEPPFPQLADGFIDLRGLEIGQMIKNAKIQSVDLTGATLVRFGQFAMCNVENTRFPFASMETNIGASFKDCDFTSAKLLRALFRGSFVNCDFSKANLSSAKGSQVKFVNCVFHKTNFMKAMLLQCTFEDCRFEDCKFGRTSFGYSKFVRSPIPEDDLGDTLL